MRCRLNMLESGTSLRNTKRSVIIGSIRASLIGLCVLYVPRASADQRVRDEATHLLAAAKEASGGAQWETVVTWHESGRIAKGSLEGTFDRWLNFVGLRNAATFDFGRSCTCEGWNGNLFWSIGPTGITRKPNSPDAITDAYWRTFAYWKPNRFPAKRTYVGTRKLEGEICDVVQITPRNGEPFELWIDRDTHLIIREVDLVGSQSRTRDFSDFREIYGIKIPATVRESTGDHTLEQITTITSLQVNIVFPADRFDPPVYLSDNGIFPKGKDSITIPFELLNNHIYLPVQLNQRAPKPFIFDTGSFNVISKEEALTQGITSEGAFPAGGLGQNTIEFGYAKVDFLDVGGLILKNQLFGTFDLSDGIRFEDLPTRGLVGYELAKQAVVVLDYDKDKITLIRPSAFRPPKRAESLPLKFRGHIPLIEAVLDGVAGEFQLDTGARPSLTLTRSFADAHGLVEKYHARREVVGGYGLGGQSRGLLARPGELDLGRLAVRAPVALISSSWRRNTAMSRIAGNIGGGLLKRFLVILDYPDGMLYLQPNPHFAEPDVFDRSGLWIMRITDRSAFEIADVVSDSPASKAGLRVGEKILKVNQADAAAFTVATLRQQLEKEPGTNVDLEVQGEDGIRTVVLVLEDLF
jgi:PDZ domain-containing protein